MAGNSVHSFNIGPYGKMFEIFSSEAKTNAKEVVHGWPFGVKNYVR